MSEIRRLFAVLFWEPGNAFADIVRKPRWWVPMLLMMACVGVWMYLIGTHIGWEQITREGIMRSSAAQNMPAADIDRLVQQQAKYAAIISPIAALLATPIGALLTAGVLTLFFSVFMGGNAKFKEVFGITPYAQLPGIVYIALSTVVLFVKPAEDFDINNPVGLNVGFYLPETAPKWMISAASSIDLISFWTMLLLVIALRKIDRKAPAGKVWGAILLPWMIYVLGKSALAAVF